MIFEIASMIILLIGIFSLFRIRDYLYKINGYKVGPYESAIVCSSCFLCLISIGLMLKNEFISLMALPFLAYLIVPLIFFNIRQWREFLWLLQIYLRR